MFEIERDNKEGQDMPRKLWPMMLVILALFSLAGVSAQAGDVILTNNTGTTSTRWFISGEPSLILNGFDLAAKGVTLPVQVEKITISVRRAMPGNPIEALVYQDSDGGSPQNASLLKRQTVDITGPGVYTVTFDQPVTVTQNFLWVGFYLPVDFEFYADTAGTSVLTYWGWKAGTVFDVSNLTTATTFGPANATAPVNLDMKGNARITAELITGKATGGTTTTNSDAIKQVVGDATTSLAPMSVYPSGCATVYYDSGDLSITYMSAINFQCRQVVGYLSPTTPTGYQRTGVLFDIYVFGMESGLTQFPFPVTHCLKPGSDANLQNGVLGLAQGAPRQWTILPTVRYGDYICAELNYAGFVSIFRPK